MLSISKYGEATKTRAWLGVRVAVVSQSHEYLVVTVTALDVENGYQAWKIQTKLSVEFRRCFSASVLSLKKN